MILLIILAFSRPTVNSGSGLGLRFQNTDLLLVIIDNTASTRDIFDEQVGPWLGDLAELMRDRGTEVRFCGATDFELHRDYRDVLPGYGDVFPETLLDRLSEQQDMEKYRKLSIAWIGDGQDVEEKLGVLPDVDVFVLQGEIERDRGILSLQLPETSLLDNETYPVGVSLGTRNLDSEVALELYVNEQRMNQTVVAQSVQQLELAARVTEPGYQEGWLELEPDEASFNDHRYFVLNAGQAIPLQVVTSYPSPGFWNMTMTALTSVEANLTMSLLGSARMDELNLGVGGTIIIDDASQVPEYVWDQLDLFLRRGGQLLLFGDGGKRMQEMFGFQESITAERSDISYALKLTSRQDVVTRSLPFSEVLNENRLKVFLRYNIGSSELDHTWIRYLDDQPFLAQQDVPGGRVIWFNTDFSLESTNLPLLGIFPALVHELGQYWQRERGIQSMGYTIGDTLSFVPPSSAEGDLLFSIQRPDGTIDFQQPDSSYTIHYDRTDIPGIYRFLRGREILLPIAVNISTHEAAAHEGSRALPSEFKVHTDPEALRAAVLSSSSGAALWPVLLVILCLLWVAEIILSRIRSAWRAND